jgi:hypothetical protein
LLPVLKADGKKWRLVHDLRAVNDIVQDCPADNHGVSCDYQHSL